MNYAQRMLGTAASFTLFGLGGIFVSQVLFRIDKKRAASQEEYQARAKSRVQEGFLFFMKFMARMGLFTYEYRGLEKIEDDRGCVVLANHPSLIDAVAVMAVYPFANCIVKDGLWENPFLRHIVTGTGYINGGQEDVLKMAEESVHRGENLIIFPEGTRSVPNQPMVLKRGAAHVALRLNRPIRFVHISMNPSTLTKAEKWYNIPARKARMTISMGERIEPDQFPSPEAPPSIRARRLNRFIQEKLENTPH